MIELITFILVCFATSYIISRENIFAKIREFKKIKFIHDILNCPNCISVYVGFFWALILFPSIPWYLGMFISYAGTKIIVTYFDLF